METIAEISGYASLLLAAELFVLLFIPIFGAYVAVRSLARLVPRLRDWLFLAQGWVVQAASWVDLGMRWVLAPILFLASLWAGVRQAVLVLAPRRRYR
mgnify:FL=1